MNQEECNNLKIICLHRNMEIHTQCLPFVSNIAALSSQMEHIVPVTHPKFISFYTLLLR